MQRRPLLRLAALPPLALPFLSRAARAADAMKVAVFSSGRPGVSRVSARLG